MRWIVANRAWLERVQSGLPETVTLVSVRIGQRRAERYRHRTPKVNLWSGGGRAKLHARKGQGQCPKQSPMRLRRCGSNLAGVAVAKRPCKPHHSVASADVPSLALRYRHRASSVLRCLHFPMCSCISSAVASPRIRFPCTSTLEGARSPSVEPLPRTPPPPQS